MSSVRAVSQTYGRNYQRKMEITGGLGLICGPVQSHCVSALLGSGPGAWHSWPVLRGCSRSWPGTGFLFPGSDGFQQPCVPGSPQQLDDFQLLALPCLAAAGSACSCPLLSLDSSGWMDSQAEGVWVAALGSACNVAFLRVPRAVSGSPGSANPAIRFPSGCRGICFCGSGVVGMPQCGPACLHLFGWCCWLLLLV